MSEIYEPGVCNIANAESNHRRNTYGLGGSAIIVALFSILTFLNVSIYVYVVLVVPIYISVIGFLQHKEKFCIWYGLNGVKNMSENIGATEQVIGQMNRKKDLVKARSIRQKAFLYTLIITAILMFFGRFI